MNTSQCPRQRWFLLAVLAAGLTCIGLFMSGSASSAPEVAVRQDAKKDEKQEPKKATPKKAVAAFPDIDEFIKKLPPAVPKDQVERIRKSLEDGKKRMEEAQKRIDDAKKRADDLQRLQARIAAAKPNRLGVRLEKPDETLVAQLGLDEGKGLVLTEVPDASVAAKAGLKSSDILLQLNGKDVSSNIVEFTAALNDIKADTAIDALVLRKGKQETIKGLKLPETPRGANERRAELKVKRKI